MVSASDANELTRGEILLKTFDTWYFKVESACNFLAASFILCLMMLGVVQVIGRSVFNEPVRGYVDIVEVAMTIFAFLGLAYCQRLGGHIRMELLLNRFHGRFLWMIEVCGTLIAIFTITVLMIYGWTHFLRAWTIGDSSIDIEITLWPSKIIVPFAFLMLLIRLLIQLAGFLRLCVKPDAVHIGIPEIETVEEIAQHEIEVGLAGEEEKVVITGDNQTGGRADG